MSRYSELIDVINSNPITSTVAVTSVASPLWLDALRSISEVAGLFLPLAGTTWLIVQIVTHFTRKKK